MKPAIRHTKRGTIIDCKADGKRIRLQVPKAIQHDETAILEWFEQKKKPSACIWEKALTLLSSDLRKDTVRNYQHAAATFRNVPPTSAKIKERVELFGATTRNTYLKWLSALANRLVEAGELTENPVKKVRRYKTEAVPSRALNAVERQKLFNALAESDNRELEFVCICIYALAIRPTELSRMEVANFDLVRWRVTVTAAASKNRRTETVAIAPPFRAKIAAWVSSRTGKLQDHKTTYLREMFYKFIDKIGIDCTLYALKHTGAIEAVQSGANIRRVSQHLRHSSITQTATYLRRFCGEEIDDYDFLGK